MHLAHCISTALSKLSDDKGPLVELPVRCMIERPNGEDGIVARRAGVAPHLLLLLLLLLYWSSWLLGQISE